MFTVIVRDTFCGIKGKYAEEQTCNTKSDNKKTQAIVKGANELAVSYD